MSGLEGKLIWPSEWFSEPNGKPELHSVYTDPAPGPVLPIADLIEWLEKHAKSGVAIGTKGLAMQKLEQELRALEGEPDWW